MTLFRCLQHRKFGKPFEELDTNEKKTVGALHHSKQVGVTLRALGVSVRECCCGVPQPHRPARTRVCACALRLSVRLPPSGETLLQTVCRLKMP